MSAMFTRFHIRSRRLGRLFEHVSRYLPELNFITLHYAYFIVTGLISGLIFWGSSTPARSVSFVDSLFLCISAMTEAGLNTVNLSTLNTWQQAMLFILIIMGSAIFVSIFVVWVRASAFETVFQEVIQKRQRDQKLKRTASGLSRAQSLLTLKRVRSVPNTITSLQNHTGFDMPASQSSNTPIDPVEKLGDESPVKSEDVLEISEKTEKPHIKFDKLPEKPMEPMNNAGDVDSEERILNRELVSRIPTINLSSTSTPFQPTLSSRHPEQLDEPSLQRQSRASRVSQALHLQHPVDKSSHFRRRLFSMRGVGASPATLRSRRNSEVRRFQSNGSISLTTVARGRSTEPYITSSGFISRNSHFHGLTWDEREQLGGYEYRAILFLSFLVPIYFVLWQLLGAIGVGAWVAAHRASTTRENGINPFWTGAFNAISAFNNSGMSLLDANMVAFQDSVFLLISMGLFILAGNTAYPIFLRMAIWAMWKILPDDENWGDEKKTLRFLLDHPRRCYTNLFPSRHTWWLALALLCLNGIDWAAFEILNIGNHNITVLNPRIEVLDGLFQALAVRSGGFYVVPIASIRISLQVLYVIMMYISVYPVVISMRNSNVYEERSLGIFTDDAETASLYTSGSQVEDRGGKLGIVGRVITRLHGGIPIQEPLNGYFVKHQLRAQLAHDVWWLALAIFLIMIIEGSQFEANPTVFSVFNVIFEIVSAYGCVGISVGVPWAAYSFCGAWHTLSKLILIAVMLRGRHRGLPVAIDHAIQLPGTKLGEAEEEDARARSRDGDAWSTAGDHAV